MIYFYNVIPMYIQLDIKFVIMIIINNYTFVNLFYTLVFDVRISVMNYYRFLSIYFIVIPSILTNYFKNLIHNSVVICTVKRRYYNI